MRSLMARTLVGGFTLLLAVQLMAAELPQPDPVKYREGIMKNGNLHGPSYGEGFCWHAAYGARDFLSAYKAYKNTAWLDEAVKYYDFYISKLSKDPDGYEGWIGNTIGNTAAIKSDALVGDAVLCIPLIKFAELVKNTPELQPKYGKKADEYHKLVKRIIWDKWNKRGCYYFDGIYGSYHTYEKKIDAKTGKWVDRPSSVISDNLNKHYKAAYTILHLWRLDPKPEYKKRVMEVFGRAKSMWRYYKDDDRVVWNFWMPHGPYDIEGKAPKSWVSVHPSRPGYQAGEVSEWVEVYDSGLVFDKTDLERIIRTNHWMMDHGPKNKEGFTNADGTAKAGTLWSSLARFDDRIMKMALDRCKNGRHPKHQIEYAYLTNVVSKQPKWDRILMKKGAKPDVVNIPMDDGKNIIMSQVIPRTIELANNDKMKLVTKTTTGGKLDIELLDKNGKTALGKIKEIDSPAKGEYFAPKWDGTNPKTGKKETGYYTLRWTLNGETRTEKIRIITGKKRAQSGPSALAQGKSIKEDFEGKPDPRLKLEGAVVTSGQAHSGGKALKIINGTKAELVFGDDENLPVKVSMWIYDPGKRFGRKTVDGPMWGIKDANGNKFVVRQSWRKYLNGDGDYVWVNSGENQFFNVHPAKVGRAKGWTQWTFDFTDPNNIQVLRGDKPTTQLNAKFTPSGAVAVIMAGGAKGIDFYVDDIEVTWK